MRRAGLHAPLLKPPVAQLCFTAFCKLPAEVQPVLPGGVGEGAAVAHGAAALLLHGDAGNAGVPAVDGRGERTSVIACTVHRSACVGKSAAAARQAHRRQVLRRARQDSVGGPGRRRGFGGGGGSWRAVRVQSRRLAQAQQGREHEGPRPAARQAAAGRSSGRLTHTCGGPAGRRARQGGRRGRKPSRGSSACCRGSPGRGSTRGGRRRVRAAATCLRLHAGAWVVERCVLGWNGWFQLAALPQWSRNPWMAQKAAIPARFPSQAPGTTFWPRAGMQDA